MRPGSRNAITDVAGIQVGLASDPRLASGVTVVFCEKPAVAGVDVRGGGPGTQETDLLDPERTVERVDAIALSGGSVFGLDAATGVRAYLAEIGRGFAVGSARVPIVPSAALFDLLNGGDKNWGRFSPYRELGFEAARSAGPEVPLGNYGAGYGATTSTLKGGLGTASIILESGITVGAIVAVNAVGSAVWGEGPHFWAAPFEIDAEFGAFGSPPSGREHEYRMRLKAGPAANTTIAVVATDAELTKSQARRLAVAAQNGLARALRPVHTPLDGDSVFAVATGLRLLRDPVIDLTYLGDAAATTLARAVARGVHAATALPFAGSLPAFADQFGRNRSAR